MIDLRLDSTDVDRTLATLENDKWRHDAMEESLALLQADMATYPTQRQTTYRRTGTLGRRWTSRINSDATRGELGNNTPYGPYVQDAQRQAHWFRGYWQTDEDVIHRREPAIRGIFERAMGRVAE